MVYASTNLDLLFRNFRLRMKYITYFTLSEDALVRHERMLFCLPRQKSILVFIDAVYYNHPDRSGFAESLYR